MLLCLDVGNSHIFAGILEGDEICFSFRYPSAQANTSDQVGVFLKSVLRENGIRVSSVQGIAICSVVPHLNYSLRAACLKYFKQEPFVLKTGARTGLRVISKNSAEIGADRIANSIAAVQFFQGQPLIVVDFGTATTFCAVSEKRDYLGGPILPGLHISMESLAQRAAMLSSVSIVTAEQCLGHSTTDHIQSGLYFGQLGAVKEILCRLRVEAFEGSSPVVIGTGGFAHLFEREGLFTKIVPGLVLYGLAIAFKKN